MQLTTILIASVTLGLAQCGTTEFPTTTTHGNHGHPIGHTFSFTYEQATHHMVLSSGKMCFISKLTSNELTLLHTNDGLLGIESRILSSLGNAISIPIADVSQHDLKHCSHGHEQFYLLHV